MEARAGRKLHPHTVSQTTKEDSEIANISAITFKRHIVDLPASCSDFLCSMLTFICLFHQFSPMRLIFEGDLVKKIISDTRYLSIWFVIFCCALRFCLFTVTKVSMWCASGLVHYFFRAYFCCRILQFSSDDLERRPFLAQDNKEMEVPCNFTSRYL